MHNRLVSFVASKNFRRWLPAYLRDVAHRRLRYRHGRPRHLLFSFCDHYEPRWGDPDQRTAEARVQAWVDRYPKLVDSFRDADGLRPRHGFFFPGEQYSARFLDGLAQLVKQGLGEVELHLHHDNDNEESLRKDLDRFLGEFASHGHLSREEDGRIRYAFIHGNWCLANARKDGRYCGVNSELPILFESGCYADFTFPATPDESQPPIVNQIYWPTGDLSQRRAADRGERARVGHRLHDRILMIQGPLCLAARKQRLPIRIEHGHVTGTDRVTRSRVRSWAAQNIHVEGQPEWVFIKVYTHGAPEQTANDLLGEGGHLLHQELQLLCHERGLSLHYVAPREMYNIAIAAMEGETGDPNQFRNYVLPPPPAVG